MPVFLEGLQIYESNLEIYSHNLGTIYNEYRMMCLEVPHAL